MNAVLIVEGFGDEQAVPELIRKVLYYHNIYNFYIQPRPIRVGDLPKFLRPGELEKYVLYASMRPDANSIIILLDCDDHCPVQTSIEMKKRISEVRTKLPMHVKVILMKKEFESLFLASFPSVSQSAPEYNWTSHEPFINPEEIRGAKETLSRRMKGRAYKETRDQVKLLSGLNLDTLRDTSSTYKHLEKTLVTLARRTSEIEAEAQEEI